MTIDIWGLISRVKFITEDEKCRLKKLRDLEAKGGNKRKPRRLKLHIKDCSEKALQRAVYLSSYSDLVFSDKTVKKVFWGDAEVPVRNKGKSSRGSCFDLLGSTEKDGEADILCELKMGKSKDSPLFAALELLAYLEVSKKDDKCCFHENSVASLLKWKKASGTQRLLIVAADSAYWDKWDKSRKWGRGLRQELAKLCGMLSFFEIRLSEKSGWFKGQKRGGKPYTPCLGPCEWREVYGRMWRRR